MASDIFGVLTPLEDEARIEYKRRMYQLRKWQRDSIAKKQAKLDKAQEIWDAMVMEDVETVRQGLLDICNESLDIYKQGIEFRTSYQDIIDLINEDIAAIKAMDGPAILCTARMYLSPPCFN